MFSDYSYNNQELFIKFLKFNNFKILKLNKFLNESRTPMSVF